MAPDVPDDPIVFSSRSADQVRRRILVQSQIGVACAVMLICLRARFHENVNLYPDASAVAWKIAILPGVMFLLSVLLTAVERGIVVIDHDGITTSGGVLWLSKRINWSEVERVVWLCDRTILIGAGRKVSIGLRSGCFPLTRREWHKARARLEAVLSPHFDLSESRPITSVERMFARKALRVWLGLVLAGYVGLLVLLGRWNPQWYPLFVLGGFMITTTVLLGSLLIDWDRYVSLQRAKHPEFPCRRRHPSRNLNPENSFQEFMTPETKN